MDRRPRAMTYDRMAFAGLLLAFLYILLLDGFLRLKTGNTSLTIVRDVLPVALLIFLTTHAAVKGRRWPRVPMRTLAAAWVMLVVVQLANPNTLELARGAAAARPHLEFLTFFFIAAATLTTMRRLETFLLVLVCCAAANGVVSLYQSSLTPAQLGTWGPGYQRLFVQQVNARVAIDAAGEKTVRPSALGSDTGFGGVLGMLALPAALAIVIVGRGWRRSVAGATIPLIIVAVLTSQTRAAVAATAIAVLAFALLSCLGNRGRMLYPLGLIAIVAAFVGNGVLDGSIDLERYSSITPTNIAGTFGQDRGASVGLVDDYITRYPFGAGIGSAGPGASVGSSANASKVSGENEFAYLLVETGVAGMLVMLLIFGSTMRRGLQLLRRSTGNSRALLSAALAALIGICTLWLATPVTANAPASPVFWTLAGCFALLTVQTPKHLGTTSPARPVPAAVSPHVSLPRRSGLTW